MPCQGTASSANAAVPAREAHISTDGLGKRSAAQPSTRYKGTVRNNSPPNKNAAVCSDTPLLARMGMMCTVAPVFASRRNAVPPVRFQNAQDRSAWCTLYSSGGRQTGGAHRGRRALEGWGGWGTPPGGSPSMVRPRCSGASVIHAAKGPEAGGVAQRQEPAAAHERPHPQHPARAPAVQAPARPQAGRPALGPRQREDERHGGVAGAKALADWGDEHREAPIDGGLVQGAEYAAQPDHPPPVKQRGPRGLVGGASSWHDRGFSSRLACWSWCTGARA